MNLTVRRAAVLGGSAALAMVLWHLDLVTSVPQNDPPGVLGGWFWWPSFLILLLVDLAAAAVLERWNPHDHRSIVTFALVGVQAVATVAYASYYRHINHIVDQDMKWPWMANLFPTVWALPAMFGGAMLGVLIARWRMGPSDHVPVNAPV